VERSMGMSILVIVTLLWVLRSSKRERGEREEGKSGRRRRLATTLPLQAQGYLVELCTDCKLFFDRLHRLSQPLDGSVVFPVPARSKE
jgi:hypothetical protein